MRFLKVYWGPLVCLLVALNLVSHCGSRWEFGGRYGMPRSLVAPGGHAYADGTAVDPLTRELIRAGIEEEVLLAAVLFVSGCTVLIILILRDTAKKRKQILQVQRMLADLRARRT